LKTGLKSENQFENLQKHKNITDNGKSDYKWQSAFQFEFWQQWNQLFPTTTPDNSDIACVIKSKDAK
jgi:hypothetical protein